MPLIHPHTKLQVIIPINLVCNHEPRTKVLSNYMCVLLQDAICTSLSEYNAHIEELKQEMKGATDSAKNIRSDIQEIRNK